MREVLKALMSGKRFKPN